MKVADSYIVMYVNVCLHFNATFC